MQLRSYTFNPFSTNLFVFHDGGEAVVVDAASHTAQEHARVVEAVRAEGLVVRHLLLTHAHIDHVFGCAELAERFGLGWQMHREDLAFLRHAPEQAQMFGVNMGEAPPEPEAFLEAGDEIRFGQTVWRVLHTPGHSPGSVSFLDEGHRLVVAGDVLFRGSIGRTDLPMGDLPTLMRSIETKLLSLPDDFRVFPGHGPETTVGAERRSNPFLQ